MKTETKDQLRAKIEKLEESNEIWAKAHERLGSRLLKQTTTILAKPCQTLPAVPRLASPRQT